MNKKKIGGFFGALALSACAAAPRPIVTPPAPPATYDLVVRVYETRNVADDDKLPGAHVALGGLTAVTDGSGNALFSGLSKGSYQVCVDAPTFVHVCQTATLPGAPLDVLLERDVPPIVPITSDGHIFMANGQPWRWKGFSSFQLLDRFAKGEDIQPVLDAYKGFNIARVWPYVPAADWGSFAWDSPSPDVVIAFLQRMAASRFYVEITLLTDDDPGRVEPAKQLVEALKAARPPNVFVEVGNEPETHKDIKTAAFVPLLQGSGLQWTTGNYEDSAKMVGTYGVTHTAREADWPRRSHDLLEFYQGGGPNAPSDPAHRMPIVADEPIRPDQAGYNANDFRAYFGSSALFGAGATFHSDSGKFGRPPTPGEASIAAVALAALNAFPADAVGGVYRRIVEPGNENGGPRESSRTYVIGAFMVRCQQLGAGAPESGWTAIDTGGVLWKR